MPTPHSPQSRRARRRRILLNRILFGLAVLILLALLVLAVQMLLHRSDASPASGAPSSASQSVSLPASDPLQPESAASELAASEQTAPQQTDWDTAGRAFMENLITQSPYTDLDLTVREGYPYLLAVNRAASCVTVYRADSAGRYTSPYMAMVCSGGSDTPLGWWNTPVNYDWRLLAGPCYGQYATRIWDSYLFHSVPYYSQHKDDLEYDEFNKLGTLASLGCIRLAVVDVKWIYDNCGIGTTTIIYDDAANPGPMGMPGTLTIDTADVEKRGWDPTDPDPANPYGTEFLAGTAIRSDAAQADWERFVAEGGVGQNLTPTDLQGWNHDSAIEGTRG